jgi:hypothetical protein
MEKDRRRAIRVAARGRVVIQGDGYGRGRILDLSADGVRFRLAGPFTAYAAADRVDLELRFDGANGGWWRLAGRIVRIDPGGSIVVAFDDVPTDFEDWIHAELVATLQAKDRPLVLLVDPIARRRATAAAALRATGRNVQEVATPLCAIHQLGESHYRPRMVAIADTIPAGIADDLRAYVRTEHPDLVLVRMAVA